MLQHKWRIGPCILALAIPLILASDSYTHCQVPCGIYDDQMRVAMIEEHITTIEKSMKLIDELSAQGDKNYNQIVRWVMNKEKHADELTQIVTYYFMAQRMKPVEPGDEKAHADYVHKLTLLHQMVVYAMKAKQTVDQENVTKLRSLVSDFKIAYFGKDAEHGHHH